MIHAVARAIALCLGIFTGLNLLAEMRCHSFKPNVWWIDLRALPHWVSWPLLGLMAVLFVSFGIRESLPRIQRRLMLVVIAALIAGTGCNVVEFYVLAAAGRFRVGVPVPLSVGVLFVLSILAWQIVQAGRSMTRGLRSAVIMAVSLVAVIGFPLGLMYGFGCTDYRRPADAIVVFGARAYSDGTPSQALDDRIRTACQLYHDGLAPRLVFSGGPGDGDIHETECMRRRAVELGVPDSAIVLDPNGLNTWATARNTGALFRVAAEDRILAVSHFYHLPRVKLAYQRLGCDVFTVPAEEEYVLTQMPFLMAREVVAFWAYYGRAIIDPNP